MAELKTKPNRKSVKAFLDTVSDPQKRKDCDTLVQLMKGITKSEPKMWGDSIVGFGEYHYKYASGREGDWFQAGFSPRKQNLTLYIMTGNKRHSDLMQNLGKHKIGKSCLYIKKLGDVDQKVLKEIVKESVSYLKSPK